MTALVLRHPKTIVQGIPCDFLCRNHGDSRVQHPTILLHRITIFFNSICYLGRSFRNQRILKLYTSWNLGFKHFLNFKKCSKIKSLELKILSTLVTEEKRKFLIVELKKINLIWKFLNSNNRVRIIDTNVLSKSIDSPFRIPVGKNNFKKSDGTSKKNLKGIRKKSICKFILLPPRGLDKMIPRSLRILSDIRKREVIVHSTRVQFPTSKRLP